MNNYKINDSRRHKIVNQPMNVSSISFDDLYEDISDRWMEKARRLLAGRWRRIKHQTA